MSAKKNKLNQLNIISPCTVSWDRMTGNEQRRYCNECSKNVYDFSRMTQSQIEAVVSARRGNLCARITRREDGSILMMESPVLTQITNRRALPIAAVTLAAMLGISAPVLAQNPLFPPLQSYRQDGRRAGQQAAKPSDKKPAGDKTEWISGIVRDPQGAVVAGAKVRLMSGDTIVSAATSSAEGRFNFPGIASGDYSLMVEAQGFRTVVVTDVQAGSPDAAQVNITLDIKQVTLGGAVAISPTSLLGLYRESDLIAVATVGESVPIEPPPQKAGPGSEDVEELQEETELRTALHISTLLKGNVTRAVIPFHHWESKAEDEENDDSIKPGDQVLVFLNQRKSEDNQPLDGYEVGDLSRSVMKLDAATMSIYRQRIEELAHVLHPDQTGNTELVEWLVRCIENSATRWDGINGLRLVPYSPATESKARTISAQIDEEETNRQAKWVAPLTQSQRDRIASVLFATENLEDSDVELVELVQNFKDARLPDFLIGQLQKIANEAPGIAESLVAHIATALNDETLRKLADNYSENAEYMGEGREENQKQQPSIAVQITTAKRTAMLKKFLAAVELKLQR